MAILRAYTPWSKLQYNAKAETPALAFSKNVWGCRYAAEDALGFEEGSVVQVGNVSKERLQVANYTVIIKGCSFRAGKREKALPRIRSVATDMTKELKLTMRRMTPRGVIRWHVHS